jgi:hypothetical protein
MSIDLIKKREEIVKVCLTKHFKPDTKKEAIVNFIIDVSGSMHSRFQNKEVQNIVERMYPIASVFNKAEGRKQELGSYIFSDKFKKLVPVTIKNYEGYVQTEIIDKNLVGGGTDYAPSIEYIVDKYKGTNIPVYNIFITDGANSDPNATKKVLLESSGERIFWSFVGIGRSTFSFLEALDKLTGRVNDNASFFAINDLADIDDEELYNRLFSEFPSFVENFVVGTYTPATPLPPSNTTRRTSLSNPNSSSTPPKKKGWLTKVIDGISDFLG